MPKKMKFVLPYNLGRKLIHKMRLDGYEDKDIVEYFRFLLKDISLDVSINQTTINEFLAMWMRNFADNLPYIRFGDNLQLVKGKYEQNNLKELAEPRYPDFTHPPKSTAVVIGRGPSVFLRNHLDLLAEAIGNGYKGMICATDGILIDCLKKGIIPDIVTCVDGAAEINKFFDHSLVRKYGPKIKVALNATVDHQVYLTCRDAKCKVYWFYAMQDDWRNPYSFTKLEGLMTVSEYSKKELQKVSCVAEGTYVFCNNGPLVIEDMNNQKKVYSMQDAKITTSDCTQLHKNGVKPVYKLKTRTREIESTAEHEFLKLKSKKGVKPNHFPNGGYHNKLHLDWESLKNLKIGDYIVVLKSLPDNQTPLKLPYHFGETTESFMYLIGLYMGDGWVRIRKTNGEIGFAIPKNNRARQKCIDTIRQIFNVEPKVTDLEIHIYRKRIAELFKELNLKHKAPNKFVPSWIFKLPKSQIKAFIRGILDADGSCYYRRGHPYYSIETASKKLADTLKLLCIAIGVRIIGNVYVRTRKVEITNQKGKKYKYPQKTTYRIRITHPDKQRANLNYVNAKAHYDLNSRYFALDKITDISLIGDRKVYDLTIKGTHSYVANGILVHNCGGNTGFVAWVMASSLFKRSPVALIGIDFGYPEGCRLEKTTYFSHIEAVPAQLRGAAVTQFFEDVHHPIFGTDAKIDKVFKSYKKTFLKAQKSMGSWYHYYGGTINCTEGGTLWGPLIACMPFKDFLRKHT